MAGVRKDENYRESWYITNNSSNKITIGDLPLVPTIDPDKTVDILKYYTREKISHSTDLVNLVKREILSLNKNTIYTNSFPGSVSINDIDEAITPAEENEVLKESEANDIYLKLDGTNANQNIGINNYALQEVGNIQFGNNDATISFTNEELQIDFASNPSTVSNVRIFGNIITEEDIIIPKTANTGIKIDTDNPTFGWKDLLGEIKTREPGGGGSNALPDFIAYRGNIYAYRFGGPLPNNHLHEAFLVYHLPHDYLPGSDIYIHIHWSQQTGETAVTEWFFELTYASGYNTDAFISPKTISVTGNTSTIAYQHIITEVIITGSTDTPVIFDKNNIEVDGLFFVRVYRTPGTGNDTATNDVFLHFVDIHYQTTGIMGTKNKNAPFYI